MSVDLTANDQPEPRAVTPTFIAVYALAYTGIWLALLTPIIVTISLRIRELTPEHAAQNLALVLSVGAACALFAGPLFGYLSDRTTSRFGMRRPWMIGGVICGSLALFALATVPTIGWILVCWCVAQIAFNATLASVTALLADQIPMFQRGTIAGILSICMPLGQLIGTYIVHLVAPSHVLAFMIPAVLGGGAVMLLAAVLVDRRLPTSVASFRWRNIFSAFRIDPFRHRDFRCAWLSRSLLAMGSAFLTTYQPLYLVEKLGRPDYEVATLLFRSMLLHSVLVVSMSLIFGRLSDRTRRRKIFVVLGATIYAIGLWLVAAASSYPQFLLGLSVAAIAHGMYFAVDLALVTDVLPDSKRDAAKDLGVINIASALPQVVAPAIGAVILSLAHDDYSSMYVVAGFITLSGAAAILPIKNVR